MTVYRQKAIGQQAKTMLASVTCKDGTELNIEIHINAYIYVYRTL